MWHRSDEDAAAEFQAMVVGDPICQLEGAALASSMRCNPSMVQAASARELDQEHGLQRIWLAVPGTRWSTDSTPGAHSKLGAANRRAGILAAAPALPSRCSSESLEQHWRGRRCCISRLANRQSPSGSQTKGSSDFKRHRFWDSCRLVSLLMTRSFWTSVIVSTP